MDGGSERLVMADDDGGSLEQLTLGPTLQRRRQQAKYPRMTL
jgi:ABC-type transport system involved in cytochrome c biogenesis permease component